MKTPVCMVQPSNYRWLGWPLTVVRDKLTIFWEVSLYARGLGRFRSELDICLAVRLASNDIKSLTGHIKLFVPCYDNTMIVEA